MRTLLAMSVLVVVMGCGGGEENHDDHNGGDQDDACPATTSVSITNFTFSPRCLRVSPSASVTFTNNDSAAHTATATAAAGFDTGTIAGGASAAITAPSAAGDHPGRCSFHPGMTFTIRVE